MDFLRLQSLSLGSAMTQKQTFNMERDAKSRPVGGIHFKFSDVLAGAQSEKNSESRMVGNRE